jgi:hypothetical protein
MMLFTNPENVNKIQMRHVKYLGFLIAKFASSAPISKFTDYLVSSHVHEGTI